MGALLDDAQSALLRAHRFGEEAVFLPSEARAALDVSAQAALQQAVTSYAALEGLWGRWLAGCGAGLRESWEAARLDLCHQIWLVHNLLDLPGQRAWEDRVRGLAGDQPLPGLQKARVELQTPPGVQLHLFRYAVGLQTRYTLRPAIPCAADGSPLPEIELAEPPRLAPESVLVAQAAELAAVARAPGVPAQVLERILSVALEFADRSSQEHACRAALMLAELGKPEFLDAWPQPGAFTLYTVFGGENTRYLLKVDGEWACQPMPEEHLDPSVLGLQDGVGFRVVDAVSGELSDLAWDSSRHRLGQQFYAQPSYAYEAGERNRLAERLLELPAGAYLVQVSRQGWQTMFLPFVLVAGDELRFDLDPELWTATPEGFCWRAGGRAYVLPLHRQHDAPLLPPERWLHEVEALRMSRHPLSLGDFRAFQADTGLREVPVRVCADGQSIWEHDYDTPQGVLFIDSLALEAYCAWLGTRFPDFLFRRARPEELHTIEGGPHNQHDGYIENAYGQVMHHTLPSGAYDPPLLDENHHGSVPVSRRIWLVAEPLGD